MTLVSIGTSVPEMVTPVYAAYYGAGDIVVGNIVGSETAQITLAVAVVALVSPFVVERRSVLVYGTAMLLAMIVMTLVLVLGLFYWRRGIDRRAAVACLLLYLPTFLFL